MSHRSQTQVLTGPSSLDPQLLWLTCLHSPLHQHPLASLTYFLSFKHDLSVPISWPLQLPFFLLKLSSLIFKCPTSCHHSIFNSNVIGSSKPALQVTPVTLHIFLFYLFHRSCQFLKCTFGLEYSTIVNLLPVEDTLPSGVTPHLIFMDRFLEVCQSSI